MWGPSYEAKNKRRYPYSLSSPGWFGECINQERSLLTRQHASYFFSPWIISLARAFAALVTLVRRMDPLSEGVQTSNFPPKKMPVCEGACGRWKKMLNKEISLVKSLRIVFFLWIVHNHQMSPIFILHFWGVVFRLPAVKDFPQMNGKISATLQPL